MSMQLEEVETKETKKTYTYNEALALSEAYFNGDELAAKVFLDKYALKDNEQNLLEATPKDMHHRIAKEFARIEAKKFKDPLSEEEIFSYLDRFQRIIPQGSPMYGIGNNYQTISLSNCFAAGTRVLTKGGPKNIEDVEIGDEVITHNNTFEKVSQLHKNKLNGRRLFDLKCFRTPSLTVTDNHKFLSISKEQEEWGESPQWNSVAYLRKGDYIAIPDHDMDSDPTYDIWDVGGLFDDTYERNEHYYDVSKNEEDIYLSTHFQSKNRDGSVTTKLKKHNSVNKKWIIDKDFAYFIGLWYGDGCVFDEYSSRGIRNRKSKGTAKVKGITFTFGSHEEDIIQFVQDYGQRLIGISPKVNDNTEIDGTTQIVFHSSILGVIFEKLFGRKCDGKIMNTKMYSWNRELVMSLVQGLIDSDGTVTKDGDLRVVLSNHELVESFYHLIRSFGIPVGLCTSVKSRSNKKYYSRLDFPKYSHLISDSNKKYNDDRIEKFSNKKEIKYHVKKIDGRTFVRIDSKIENFTSPEYVYTFGVDNYHSYPVEGLVSQNCFVADSPLDSYAGIMHTDHQLVQLSKRRGGVGTDISHIRPQGVTTHNAARTSTGIIPFMERFSNSIREVGQNGRRGALMLTISVHHPEVLSFATIKKDLTKVTGANISIRLSDEFLNAVEKKEEFELRWPVDAREKGEEPVISKMVDAHELWMQIIDNAWAMAEPGLLFWDNAMRESPADCYSDVGFKSTSTNPCSEIILSPLDSCRLLLLNLYGYVNDPFTSKAEFDFDRFYEDAQVAQRLMDDLIDLELEKIDAIIKKVKKDPEPLDVKKGEIELWERIKKACEDGRRTGTGITAIGDAMAACGIKYGSNKSINFTDKVYKTLKLGCYRSSVDMAKELGAFNVWDHEKEKRCPFLLRIKEEDPQIWKDMKKWGRRNIALLTTAPCGSVSIESQTTSGIEPLFMIYFTRKKKINPNDENTRTDSVDQNGDHWQHFRVFHPKVKVWMEVKGIDEKSLNESELEDVIKKSPWHGCCAEDLDWKQRVKLQGTANKHVDHAISSTINLPEDVTPQQVAAIYEESWRQGLKGITVYRKNCRTGVLVEEKKETHKDSKEFITKNDAPKRPQELPGDIHHHKVKGEDYFVIVGLLNDDPYEVFTGKNGFIDKKYKECIVKKIKRGQYEARFEGGAVVENISSHVTDEEEAITRMVSTALRHGADVAYVVHQLEKVNTNMFSFSKALQRALKKYIADGVKVSGEKCPGCESENVQRRDGCITCMECGWSKCG